jgi:hypothetical protein
MAFTNEEDELIRKLVAHHGTNAWDLIAAQMMGRTPRQCRERWNSYLMPSLRNGPWDAEEDTQLVHLVRQFGNKWVAISKFFYGRSDSNVKNRWYTHFVKSKSGKYAAPLRKLSVTQPVPTTRFVDLPHEGKTREDVVPPLVGQRGSSKWPGDWLPEEAVVWADDESLFPSFQ